MLRPSGPALPSLRTNWRTLGRQSFSYAWPIRVSSAYSYWAFELFRIAPYPLRGIRSFKRIGRVNFAGVFFLPKYNTRQTVVRIRDSCLDTGSTPAISTILSNMPRKWAFSVCGFRNGFRVDGKRGWIAINQDGLYGKSMSLLLNLAWGKVNSS